MTEGVRTGLALAYFVVSTAFLIWPLHTWLGNHIEPRVFGLPWSLVYVLAFVAANFVVLSLLYATRSIDHAEEDDG